MTRVNVEGIAFTDSRFSRLAQLLGLADGDHARSKVEHLWLACTIRGELELPKWVVEQHLGPQGPDALVSAELARWGRGRGDSNTRRMYICGARGRTEWYSNNKEHSSKGGKARARNASRVAGRFTSQESDGLDDSCIELTSEMPSSLHDRDSEVTAKNDSSSQVADNSGGSTSRVAGDSTSAPAPAPAPALKNSEAPAEPSPAFSLTSEPEQPTGPRHPRLDPNTDHGRAIAAFDAAYARAYGAKPTWGAKPGALISKLLKAHGLAEVQRRIGVLFTAPPEWLKPPFDVATLSQHFDKLVQAESPKRTEPKIASIPIAPSSRRGS